MKILTYVPYDIQVSAISGLTSLLTGTGTLEYSEYSSTVCSTYCILPVVVARMVPGPLR